MALDLMNRIFKKGHKLIRRTEKQVLRFLIQKGSKEVNGLVTNIYPTIQTIADYCDVCEKSVRTALTNIEKAGLIHVDSYRAKGIKCYSANMVEIEKVLEPIQKISSVTITDLNLPTPVTITDLKPLTPVIEEVRSVIASTRSVTITDNPLDPLLNNLTIDLSNTIDDRKDNLVQLVDKKIKTEEELARDWFYEQLNKMKKDNLIALEILQSKDISILFAEGMYHALNRDQAVFPKLSHALKGMMKLLVAGSWSTPTGMQKKQSVAPREARAYDKQPRPESLTDIGYKRTPEEKSSGLKSLSEILGGLRKKGGALGMNAH